LLATYYCRVLIAASGLGGHRRYRSMVLASLTCALENTYLTQQPQGTKVAIVDVTNVE
jgi:hypothetical protein